MIDTVRGLEGAPNFRDFGGYPAEDGWVVRRGLLFRSGALGALTGQDYEQLNILGIRLICDLRSSVEMAHQSPCWPALFRPEVMHLDINADLRTGQAGMLEILRDSPSEACAQEVMRHTYREIVLALQPHLAQFFSRLADENGAPVIVHCTAGKDRTGVVAALVQLALGVPREHVLADYLLTARRIDQAWLEAMIGELMLRTFGTCLSPESLSAVAGVRESYLDAALDLIADTYGSLDGYLSAAGVDAVMLRQLHARLLAPA
jgi:protein-tyrosine phosphatase